MQSTIVIADDHPLILKGLQDYLQEKNYQVIGLAKNGQEAWEMIQDKSPDIAILDIQMPKMSGLDVVRKCQQEGCATKIILITLEKDLDVFKKARELTIFGYVLKEFALEEIELCLTLVEKGIPYFSQDLTDHLERPSIPEGYDELTPTEHDVLKHMALNLTAKEIGEKMFISHRTVEKHKSNIIRKLNIPPLQNSLIIWVKEHQVLLE